MTRFTLIGAVAVSLLALAAPAMAGPAGTHRGHHRHRHYVRDVRIIRPALPVQDALRYGYGTGCHSFPSGYGGLYRDGVYPGNVYDNCFTSY
jgi:hypothetical protein